MRWAILGVHYITPRALHTITLSLGEGIPNLATVETRSHKRADKPHVWNHKVGVHIGVHLPTKSWVTFLTIGPENGAFEHTNEGMRIGIPPLVSMAVWRFPPIQNTYGLG